MARQSGGTKRSSWLAFRRRLLLVRLLLRGPMGPARLIAEVQDELGDDIYPPAAPSALKHDLDALRSEFGCRISFRRADHSYVLEDLGSLQLLDLPDPCLDALAFLDASYPAGATLPEHAGIRDLVERLVVLLPPGRLKQHDQGRQMRLRPVGHSWDQVDATVLAAVRRGIARQQELAFLYHSPYDDEPRQHRVAPYAIFFGPEGHAYLDAALIEASPRGPEPTHAAISYRLDRIVRGSIRVLPQMLPKEPVKPRSYAVRYRLLPAVAARRDLAASFPDTEIVYHEDGSATLTATVTNLWQTRQTLLRHGPGCIVLEPPELVEMFRAAALELVALYSPTGERSEG